jgi:hypothetical protein
LLTSLIERFLRTGEETWDGAGSGRFTLAQLNEDQAHTRATKTALRTLFRMLTDLLSAEAQVAPQVRPETIERSAGPLVKGLVQDDWQEDLRTEFSGSQSGHGSRIVDLLHGNGVADPLGNVWGLWAETRGN